MSKRTRLSESLLLSAVLMALTAGVAAAKDKVTISLIQLLTAQEWASEFANGARAAVADLGADKVQLRIQGPAGWDLQKEAQTALSEVERGTDAIILTNGGGMIEPAHLIEQKGVPVTWILVAPPDEVSGAFFVGSDNYAVGSAGADLIIPVLEKKYGKPASEISGVVVQGICVPGATNLSRRLAGIEDAVKRRMPKATVLPPFDSKLEYAQSYAAWDQAIKKYPKALFYTDPCQDPNESIQKIRADDKLDVPQVYYDNPEVARLAVKTGEITGIVSSNRFTEGYVAVYVTAQRLLKNEKMPVGWLKVPHKVITTANADDFIAAWANSGAGLRKFYDKEITATRDLPLSQLPPTSEYNRSSK